MKCDHYSCVRDADFLASRHLDGDYCPRHARAVNKALSVLGGASFNESITSEFANEAPRVFSGTLLA